MDYVELGRQVRRRRLEIGWTQEALAKEIGVSTSFVGHIERGTRKASLETVVAISNAMSVSLDDLLAESLIGKIKPAPKERVVMREILQTLQEHISHWDDE